MRKFVIASSLVLATPAASIELDDRYALVGELPGTICTTIAALDNWYALLAAGRKQEALAMPDCLLLEKGSKVLIVEREVAGYMRGLWTSPSGSSIDIWMRAYPNMTEQDFAIFDCQHHRPRCTREIFEAVKDYMSPFDKWEPSK